MNMMLLWHGGKVNDSEEEKRYCHRKYWSYVFVMKHIKIWKEKVEEKIRIGRKNFSCKSLMGTDVS